MERSPCGMGMGRGACLGRSIFIFWRFFSFSCAGPPVTGHGNKLFVLSVHDFQHKSCCQCVKLCNGLIIW